MKTPNLIDVPKDSKSRHERLREFKVEHWIWTHKGNSEDYPWSALAYADALKALSGYGLPESVRNDPMQVIAGYCRLLDDCGLLVIGETERDAVWKLCRNVGLEFPR